LSASDAISSGRKASVVRYSAVKMNVTMMVLNGCRPQSHSAH
jgi:hypothetical protein